MCEKVFYTCRTKNYNSSDHNFINNSIPKKINDVECFGPFELLDYYDNIVSIKKNFKTIPICKNYPEFIQTYLVKKQYYNEKQKNKK